MNANEGIHDPSIATPFRYQADLADIFFTHSLSSIAILDRVFNFVRVNRAYAETQRRDAADLVGRNLFELFPSNLKEIFESVVFSKQALTTTARAVLFAEQPERGVTYWDWTLVPILNSDSEVELLVLSAAEVTERKQAETALQIAAQVYQHSSEAMIIVSENNHVVSVNSAFSNITGYQEHEVVGKHVKHFASEHHSKEFHDSLQQLLGSTGYWQGEIWERTKAGKDIALRMTINTVCDNAGSVQRRIVLCSDVTDKKNAEAQIWRQANFDELTKLPNRLMFLDGLQKDLASALSMASQLTIMIIDLDQFKEINDTLGHGKGDQLLSCVAKRLIACIPKTVTAARLGGDEFALLLSTPEDVNAAEQIAHSIVVCLAEKFELDVESVFVSASVGIATYPRDGRVIEDLMRHADQAMYVAKSAGRNRYIFFTQSMQDAVEKRVRLTSDLRDALANNQLEVYYHPIVELSTGLIVKAEALLRWHHPTRGAIGPNEFIPLAETSDLILKIGTWVFKQAAAQAKRLLDRGRSIQISVNVSPKQFYNDSAFHVAWLQHLYSLELSASSIVIEITEGLLLDVNSDVKDKLRAFHEAGTLISLDDFGTGYSSLAYLNKFDIDFLKIDRAFVRDLHEESDNRSLCEAIIVMAHKLGLKVIAEGVEDVGQRDFLCNAGCDLAQGFLYTMPLPAQVFESMLTKES